MQSNFADLDKEGEVGGEEMRILLLFHVPPDALVTSQSLRKPVMSLTQL